MQIFPNDGHPVGSLGMEPWSLSVPFSSLVCHLGRYLHVCSSKLHPVDYKQLCDTVSPNPSFSVVAIVNFWFFATLFFCSSSQKSEASVFLVCCTLHATGPLSGTTWQEHQGEDMTELLQSACCCSFLRTSDCCPMCSVPFLQRHSVHHAHSILPGLGNATSSSNSFTEV